MIFFITICAPDLNFKVHALVKKTYFFHINLFSVFIKSNRDEIIKMHNFIIDEYFESRVLWKTNLKLL